MSVNWKKSFIILIVKIITLQVKVMKLVLLSAKS